MHCSSFDYHAARIKYKNLKPGTVIFVKKPEHAYYSGYAGNTRCQLEPTDRATVVNPAVPYVTGPERVFVLVEFKKFDKVWRAAVSYDNVGGIYECEKERPADRPQEESEAPASAK